MWLETSLERLDETALGRRSHGVIEAAAGRMTGIRLRPWPKLISVLEIELFSRRVHHSRPGDRCLLFYNQSRKWPNYLAIGYLVSHRDCSLATLQAALETLDEVARIKRTDALLCDVWNARISDRMLMRYGWQPHKPSRWHRNFIKRFYGTYPGRSTESRYLAEADPGSAVAAR